MLRAVSQFRQMNLIIDHVKSCLSRPGGGFRIIHIFLIFHYSHQMVATAIRSQRSGPQWLSLEDYKPLSILDLGSRCSRYFRNISRCRLRFRENTSHSQTRFTKPHLVFRSGSEMRPGESCSVGRPEFCRPLCREP